ncbi:hypothetical protein JCM3774_005100 [Rhodotorula dairenensis]
MQLHSTSHAVSSLVVLAHDSLRDHISDYADAHRWIDSFFDKLESRATSSNGAPRPALSELMKTPGRKRTVGANATNQAAAGHSVASARKDPLATLLFADAGSARNRSPHNKENSTFSPTGARTSPRKMLSPLAGGAAASQVGKPAASPIRLSPRPPPAPKQKERETTQPASETAPIQEPVVAETSPPVPVEPIQLVAEPPVRGQSELTATVPDATEEEPKADLSIIGEEEEEEGEEEAPEFEDASSRRPSETATSIVTETQFSQAVSDAPTQPIRSVMSPPRNVSNASSVAPEADAEEDHTVPLNDAPSTLRSVDLSSSLSASTTRTPGSSTSRFTLGTYSAGKLGGLSLGSSPPPAGTAPSTAGGRLANPRISSGGPAPRQLNFVGLPKKSLGHGLGLGRGWNNQSASDTQGSTGTSKGATSETLQVVAVEVEVEQAMSFTATGSTKRKSLTGPDLANKAPKLAEPALTEQELKRKRYEELNSRMQSLQARQSVLGGRASNVAGPFGANAIFGANKPFSGSTSALFQQTTAPVSTAKATVAATAAIAPSVAAASEAAAANNTRRPSVMERVRSFESNTTGTEAMHPPSPSKIPAALASNVHHVARPTSPPLSPRRLASPSAAAASPRLLGRSASSALPLASFGNPRAQSATASPRLAAMSRSPTAQASMSISSILEPAPKAPAAKLQSPAKSPVRPQTSTTAARSSTPVGSPPTLDLQVKLAEAKARQQLGPETRPFEAPIAEKVVCDEAEEQEEEEEEPVMSIRAINASVDPATVEAAEAKKRAEAEAAAETERVRSEREAVARRTAEQAARAQEDQEAQRERDDQLKKRLPSLPEPKAPTDDEASSSEEEREELATKSGQNGPQKDPKVMPGSFAAADEMEHDDDDFTSMSVMSTATASSTLNLTNHQPFKPVVAHKAAGQVQKPAAKSSIASSASTTSTLSRSVTNNVLATSVSKKPKVEVNAVKRAAAAAKKEKEERERQAALREEKRAALLKRKQEEERKAKVEGLEKKRKEREEAAVKAAKGGVPRGVKPKVDEEPAKKRKIEPDARSVQPSLAASQGRAGGMGPPHSALTKSTGASSALSKSTGATAMIGHSFMSSKINLAVGTAVSAPTRPPAPAASKPFGSAVASVPRPVVEQQRAAVVPAPEPEVPYQELPDIDSEYSDSDDEVAQEQKQAALPGWAKSPNLVRALQRQQEINPDDIFGPIPKLSIGEMFRNANSTARLRLRTSSARWEGTDDLTQADIARYHRAMGFRTTSQQPGPSNNQQ